MVYRALKPLFDSSAA